MYLYWTESGDQNVEKETDQLFDAPERFWYLKIKTLK